MTDVAPPQPTVAATIRAMRRAGSAGKPVSSGQVAEWAQALLDQLYGEQKPVRTEVRKKHSAAPWLKAEYSDVASGHRRGMEFRCLYLHPKATKPAKEHRWSADGTRCLDCKELFWIHGPDCLTDYRAPDPRMTQAINLTWFKEPLQKLHDVAAKLSRFDRDKWKRETTYLLERIAQYEKESKA